MSKSWWVASAGVVLMLGLLGPVGHSQGAAGRAAPPTAGSAAVSAVPVVAKKPSRRQAKRMYRVIVRRAGGALSHVCGARVSSRRYGGLRWGRVISQLRPNACRGYVMLLVKPAGKGWRWKQSLGSEWPGAPWSCDAAKGVPDRVLREFTGYSCRHGGKPKRV